MSSCEHGTRYAAYNCSCWVCAQRNTDAPLQLPWFPARLTRNLFIGVVLGLLAAWAIGSVQL